MSVRAALILASDRVSRGEREDATAEGVRAVLAEAGVTLDEVTAVPDERAALSAALLPGVRLRAGAVGDCATDLEAGRAADDPATPGGNADRVG